MTRLGARALAAVTGAGVVVASGVLGDGVLERTLGALAAAFAGAAWGFLQHGEGG